MFGINKNGIKHKVGIIMPSLFPASRTTYDNATSGLSATTVQGAINEVYAGRLKYKQMVVTTSPSSDILGNYGTRNDVGLYGKTVLGAFIYGGGAENGYCMANQTRVSVWSTFAGDIPVNILYLE